ncbi:MAG: DUF4397 domain-containing protein [Anaerolineae bacterium]|nr:DUF4397 domain-containing protein [Anaerolineae bacterium]MDQ7034596.1 DUF4397 domain-containing protein [Anaerolineae bacterium]
MRKLVLLASFLVILILAIVPVSAQGGSSAFVRIAHFAINVDDVDVYIDGNLRSIGRDLGYGTATSWLVVPAGDFEFAVTPAGRSMNAAIIESTVVSLEAGSRTTIVALGDTQTTGITAHVITEDYDDLPEFQARVTVLHADPALGAVDLWSDGELFQGRMAYPGSLTLLSGGTNDGVTSFDMVEGRYDFTVVPNGQSGPVMIDMSDTDLTAQTFYFVVLTRDEDGNPSAVVIEQTAN